MPNTINKNIILIGPGHLPIPVQGSNGWGGIENTLTWIVQEFDKRNQQYLLINDQYNFIQKIKNIETTISSLIHVHYDDYVGPIKNSCISPIFSTSHSPYHPFLNMWKGDIHNHFSRLFNFSDCYLGQSLVSNENAIKLNPFLKTGLCRCGIPDLLFSSFRKEKGNKKSLVLGKIEPRKNQAFLQNSFANDIYMDFVGPVADNNFIANNIGKTSYLGTWSREQVIQNMTNYSSIILLSNFEGDVLIVKEALASGCSLIISDKAALNLNLNKPFIKMVSSIDSKEQFISLVNSTNEENEQHRSDIIKYFKQTFEISVTVDEYIDSIKNFYA